MEKETYYIVNKDGEVISEVSGDTSKIREIGDSSRIIIAEDGDRLIKRNTQIAYDEKKNNRTEVKINFSKINRKYMDKISWKYPLVITLTKYISYFSNILAYSNGKLLNPTNLSRVTGISLSTCKRQFKSLMELGIVKRIKLGGKYAYVFDPYLANCSKDINNDTLDMFKMSEYREEK